MTNQRRRELIELYSDVVERGAEYGHRSSIIDLDDLDDLLALLREDGLEWKVRLHSSPTGMGYYPPELMATCSSESAARHMAKFWGVQYTAITGPGEGEGGDLGDPRVRQSLSDEASRAASRDCAQMSRDIWRATSPYTGIPEGVVI